MKLFFSYGLFIVVCSLMLFFTMTANGPKLSEAGAKTSAVTAVKFIIKI
jgi:hypothetical protein